MDLQARKHEFIQALNKLDKLEVMDKLEEILKKEQPIYDIDIEEYNRCIDQSLEEIDQGNVFTHEEVGEHIKEWSRK